MEDSQKSTEIVIVIDRLHPRIQYVMETVFVDFLGLTPLLLESKEMRALELARSRTLPIFHYRTIPSNVDFLLPCCGLLEEDIIRQANETIDWFGPISSQLRAPDLLAQIFYHLTQYPLLQPAARLQKDRHGRYIDGDGKLVVHQLLSQLKQLVFPKLKTAPATRQFDYEITIDVDQPWKHRHKPFLVQAGGLLGELLRFRWPTERIQAIFFRKDPFDVLPTVQAICPSPQTKVFFLVGGSHKTHDSRFHIRMKPYQSLVRKWQAAGFEVGIHPSYASSHNAEMMQVEKSELEAFVGPVQISRQHYLRYETPSTFRQLIALGIRRDYSLCLHGQTGAPSGVCIPYRWFDLQKNEATALWLVPAMVMDRTLLQYLQLDPDAAAIEIRRVIQEVRSVGGKFVIILHNETFSDVGEWEGWLPMIRQILSKLKQ